MEELKIKKDFTDIYTQDSLVEYLKEMGRLGYSMSDSTKPLYNAIIEKIEETLSRPINILDLGSPIMQITTLTPDCPRLNF